MKKLVRQGYKVAYNAIEGKSPCVIFCGGFNSSMLGNKALALEKHCIEKGQAFIRFDYFAHGESTGDFAEGSISRWLDDTLTVIDEIAYGDVVLVGSSMGGWLSLLAALQRPERVKSLVLVACAVDMTMYYPQRVQEFPQDTDAQGRGFYVVPNQYDNQEPYYIFQQMIDDGKQHFLLDKPLELNIPVHLVHGKQDDVVDWQRSEQVHELLCANCNNEKYHLHIVDDGDHRLSRAQDLELLTSILDSCLNWPSSFKDI